MNFWAMIRFYIAHIDLGFSMAELARMTCEITVEECSYLIQVSGFSDKLCSFVRRVLNEIARCGCLLLLPVCVLSSITALSPGTPRSISREPTPPIALVLVV